MGLFTRRSKTEDDVPAVASRSVVASAMPLSGPEGRQAWKARSGDDSWQRQAWYFYDAIGELRFAFNWLASAASRATLYAAEIDPETGLITGPTEDARARAVAAAILGGADDRPQLQSTLFLQWQVTGETFVVILPQAAPAPDRWVVLSSSSLREQSGSWSFKDPLTGVWTKLVEPRDRIIRVWSPHPNDQTHADSAMRAALPICTEVEKCSQNIISRLDSRLVGNGMWAVPKEIDFETADGEPANAQSLMKVLMQAAEIGIREPGTAAAQVPIMFDVPGEMLANLKDGILDFAKEMDSQVTDLRKEALNRLGNTLEMSREIATGTMSDANHWSAWQIEEGTYKIHLEPPLLKFGMALVKEYFRPALVAMGETNPDRFVLAWDVTEVVARPDDSENDKYMHEQRLVSDDWLRGRMGIPDDAIPSDEEMQLRRLEDAVKIAPSLAADGQVARTLFGFELAPAAAGVSESAADAPALEAGGTTDNVRALPAREATPPEPDEGLVAAAELVVFDALSRAGNRLLTREYRGQFASTPKHELHTVVPVTERDLPRLMEGSFQFVGNIAGTFGRLHITLERELRQYTESVLLSERVHSRDELRRVLA